MLLGRSGEAPLPGGPRGRGGRQEGREGAIYITISVACGWEGAVMRKLLAKGKCYGPMDGRMVGRTDPHIDLKKFCARD